jgi:hypothetical protein
MDCRPAMPVTHALPFVTRRGLLETPLPLNVDHRVDGAEGPIKYQGLVGACTAFSLSTAMDNAIRREGKHETVSPLHIWSRYRIPEMGEAGDDNLKKGVAAESSWPYDPAKACRLAKEDESGCGRAYHVSVNSADAVLEAEAKHADSEGRFVLASVDELHRSPGDPNEMAAVIAGGDSVWACFNVNRASWQIFDGRDTIPDYAEVGPDGHAVVLSGYRTVNGRKEFLVHNSWGPEWGDHGFAWISESMIRGQLRAAYRVQVAERIEMPDGGAPQPPVPPPTANGCPQGQVRDYVYGNCSFPCESGSPPSAGFCLPRLPGFPFPLSPPPQGQQPAPPAPVPSTSAQPAAPAPPAPQPPGPTQPTAAPCPSGQTSDLLTGACTGFCPNGMPAIGGLCLPFLHYGRSR